MARSSRGDGRLVIGFGVPDGPCVPLPPGAFPVPVMPWVLSLVLAQVSQAPSTRTPPTQQIGKESVETGEKAYRDGQRATAHEQRLALFAEGVTRARAYLAQHPDAPEGLLWLVANLGGHALERGKLLALGAIPEIEQTLKRLDEVAPSFEGGAGARGLARLYQKAPALISVGSAKRARQHYERALALGPNHIANQALAADFFWDQGDRDRARSLAEAAAKQPALRADTPDAREWREIVEQVLGRTVTVNP